MRFRIKRASNHNVRPVSIATEGPPDEWGDTAYYVEVETLEQLLCLDKRSGMLSWDLVVDRDDMSIVICDDYVE
jgi:hypothetical protein